MTRQQLEAMIKAARARADEYKRQATELHSRRLYDLSNSMGVSYAVALTMSEMLEAALALTE